MDLSYTTRWTTSGSPEGGSQFPDALDTTSVTLVVSWRSFPPHTSFWDATSYDIEIQKAWTTTFNKHKLAK